MAIVDVKRPTNSKVEFVVLVDFVIVIFVVVEFVQIGFVDLVDFD
jgi:hypothetical protein